MKLSKAKLNIESLSLAPLEQEHSSPSMLVSNLHLCWRIDGAIKEIAFVLGKLCVPRIIPLNYPSIGFR